MYRSYLSEQLFQGGPVHCQHTQGILKRSNLIHRSKSNFTFRHCIPDTTHIHDSYISRLANRPHCCLTKYIGHQIRQRRLRTVCSQILCRMSDNRRHNTIYFLLIRFQDIQRFGIRFTVVHISNGHPSAFHTCQRIT